MSNERDLTQEEARADHARMLRFLGVNAAFGMALGFSMAALMVWLDVAGLGSRIARSQTPVLAFILLCAPLSSTFAGALTASAIMMLPDRRRHRD